MDGLSNQRAGGAGVILQSPEGDVVECAVCCQFPTTNNDSKYEAVLVGLNLTKVVEALSIVIHYDSQVVVGHINEENEAKGEWMKRYLSMVKGKVSEGLSAKFVQILREENEQANHLAKVASIEHMVITSQVLSFI